MKVELYVTKTVLTSVNVQELEQIKVELCGEFGGLTEIDNCKGFGNCTQFNHKRDPKVFTFLESEFAKLAESYNCQFNHEVRVKCKDKLNRQHIFKLDFLEHSKRVNVEISPNWHKNYILVNRRDALRKRLLKKHGIKSLTVPVIQKGPHGHIDYARAKRILRYIESLTPSVNSLDYWVTESLTKGVNSQ